MDEYQDASEQALPAAPSETLLDAPITRRKLMLASAAAFFVPVLHANAAGSPQAGRPPKGQVIVGLTQEPTVFNPLMPRLEVDQGVGFALFNPLWRADPDGSFVPELAAEVPTLENGGISSDGLQWRVKLRKGVKWHDGAEFSAEDVKYTLELLNNPAFRAYTRQGHSLVRDVTVHGPYEVSWRMTRAYAPYLALLTWTLIVPKHVLEKSADVNTAPFNSAPIGTGPFKWGARVAGQSITVVANKAYFDEGPFVERVVFHYVPDADVLYTQFKTGQVDYLGYYGLPAQYYKEAQSLPNRKMLKTSSAQVVNIAMNFGRPIFQDIAVRRALYFGMNKKAIIDLVYYGIPTETESIVSRTSWAYNPSLPKHTYDIAAGNKVLEDAGWLKGADGIRAKGGQRLVFTVASVSGDPQREQILQLLQQDWAKMGISMGIKAMPAAVVFGEYYTKSQFDCFLITTTFGTGADPDPTQRLSSSAIPIQGGSGTNYFQYKNPEIDRLLQVAQSTFKREERKAAYLKIQSIAREDLFVLPICQPAPIEGTKANLAGLRSNPNVSSNCWNMGRWSWDA